MKNKILIISTIFLFIGCAIPSKNIVSNISNPTKDGMIVGTISLEDRKSTASGHYFFFGNDSIKKKIALKEYDAPLTYNSTKWKYGLIIRNSKGNFKEGKKDVYLFNIVKPHRAYFGKKDYQQLAIIKKMVKDLNFDVEIIGCDIIRSEKGLALSSRNSYLSDLEKEESLILSKTLKLIADKIAAGEKNSKALIDFSIESIHSVPSTKVDYIKIVNNETMEDLEIINRNALIALAVFINDKVRLIDNLEIIGE